ncbi:MAG: succinylglutamate desuccinylase/aspartoacylase family protein [Halodesulfurarchaeum sp.]
MRVEQLGDGAPDISIVAAIHGDEPCGVRAVDRLLEDAPSLETPVKLIVANEEALSRNERYLDADLNRSFDRDGPVRAHEHELAIRLAAEVRDSTVLSIHSTRSYEDPFAISAGLGSHVERIVPHLSVDALVDASETMNGRLFEVDASVIEVEAGLQGSEGAAENAYRLAREFLTATGALPGDTVARDLPAFKLTRPIEKPQAASYDVFTPNFSRVEAGEAFASAGDQMLRAESPFWPVLLSSDGYRDIFGYESERLETVSPT